MAQYYRLGKNFDKYNFIRVTMMHFPSRSDQATQVSGDC